MSDSNTDIICVNYEKNFYLPVTNVSTEYYSRQLSLHNFCIHNMKNNNAFMFMYSENFALKGPNETISFVEFYLKNKINTQSKQLNIFSDNNFAQNKCRYIWAYYQNLVLNNNFEKITIYYPIPGHSYLSCDRNFALIEKIRNKTDKFLVPMDYVNIVENANKQNSFSVIFANYPLTNNLLPDNHDIVIIKDYKSLLNQNIKLSLDHLSDVRIIEFTKNEINISLYLRKPPNIELKLLKNSDNFINIFNNLKPAYNDFLTIKQEKYTDIQKLLNFVHLPDNTNFYSDKYLKSKLSHSNMLINNLTNCNCIGLCVRNCFCKINKKICTNLCSCNFIKCKNK